MTPERWARLQSIFNQAIEVPIAERGRFVAAACAGDDELRREAEEMLAFDAGSEERLRSAIGGAVTEAVHGEQNRLIGTVIGAYRIRGVLGYGGMGTVYDAERADDQFRQRVAIKLVQQMAVHPQLRTRLRAERQILANLDHPYIARLIDGGETANGTPYLVIDFVDGLPIDRYCDAHKLGVEERLVLFEKVCSAVDYAHRNLVVHRDLKPANILVTADGTPKLLDFGIAKLLNPDPAWNTVAVTRVQDRLLTPEHASPEQVLGRTITTASDVYALGVLLYEILGGRSPYALKNSTPLALERAICNEDPPRLSSLFRKAPNSNVRAEDGFDPAEVAARRRVGTKRLRRQLEGDIDEVVLHAMRKEPEQRYATAGQLAEELRRHRSGEAVLARQGVRRYRIAKFIRRNALSMSMVLVVIVALTTFATFMWRQTQRLEEQKALVTQERDRAQQVSSFLVDIFASANLYHTQGEEVTARELLDRGAESIKDNLSEQPEVRAQMLDSIGYAYQSQGLFARAVPLLEQALEIRRQSGNTPNKALATNLLNLGNALRDAGNAATAQLYYEQALALTRQLAGERSVEAADVLVSMARLARENNSQLEQALALFNEALAIYRERYGSDHVEIASTLSDLANLLLWTGGDLAVAERHQREALRIYQRHLKRTHPDYATALGALGIILLRRDRLEEADALIQESLELLRAVFGAESSRVADMLGTQADVRDRQGRYTEAISLVEEAIAIQRRSGGKDYQTGYYEDSLARYNFKADRYAAAEQHIRAALAIYQQTLADDHLYIASSQHFLGEVLLARGDPEAAAEALRISVAICTKAAGAESWRTARSESLLGSALSQLGKRAEAERLLVESHRTLLQTQGADDDDTRAARQRVLTFLRSQGREREAPRLLAPAASS